MTVNMHGEDSMLSENDERDQQQIEAATLFGLPVVKIEWPVAKQRDEAVETLERVGAILGAMRVTDAKSDLVRGILRAIVVIQEWEGRHKHE
jgi:hypothetical protein